MQKSVSSPSNTPQFLPRDQTGFLRQSDGTRGYESLGAISHLSLTVVAPTMYLAALAPSAGEDIANRKLDPIGERRRHRDRCG
jgi:hypothetical protein